MVTFHELAYQYSNTVLCFCFDYLPLVVFMSMLPVFKDYLFLIAPSVFSNVYLSWFEEMHNDDSQFS